MELLLRLLEAHRERIMEDNNENKEFKPSPACLAWSKASTVTSLTSIFASMMVPAAAPIVLTLAAAFTVKALCLSVKERKAHKRKEEKPLNTY